MGEPYRSYLYQSQRHSLTFWPFAVGRHHGRVWVEVGTRWRLQATPVPHDPQLPVGLRHSALLYDPHRHLWVGLVWEAITRAAWAESERRVGFSPWRKRHVSISGPDGAVHPSRKARSSQPQALVIWSSSELSALLIAHHVHYVSEATYQCCEVGLLLQSGMKWFIKSAPRWGLESDLFFFPLKNNPPKTNI